MIFYLRIHGFPYPGMFKDYIQKLENFHKNNSGSVYAILGYVYLSMQQRFLRVKDLILPVFMLAGDSSTGKSSLVKQICSILPHSVVDGFYKRNYENSAMVTVIQERVAKEGTPLIMDPPPIPDKKDDLNKVIDMIYKAKLKNTAHTKHCAAC